MKVTVEERAPRVRADYPRLYRGETGAHILYLERDRCGWWLLNGEIGSSVTPERDLPKGYQRIRSPVTTA